MRVKKKIGISLAIVVLLLLTKTLWYDGFSIKRDDTGFIWVGFTGLDALLDGDSTSKVEWNWKEYPQYALEGKDGEYLFFSQTDSVYKVVGVRDSERIYQRTYTHFPVLQIYTHHTPYSFQIRESNPCQIPATTYQTTGKILAISDIEGSFTKLYPFLRNHGVMNDSLQWTFQNNHLVLLGDYFDRGNNVTACLWLIYKLESEAKRAGGGVHFILGNHEQMNLAGSVNYVSPRYLALAQALKIPYKELYSAQSELGKWLRTKNTIEKINGYLFCHGGLNPQILSYKISLEVINSRIRTTLGMSQEETRFSKSPIDAFLAGQKGPLWYRGYFQGYKEAYTQATQLQIDSLLGYYQAEKIIVGHTIVPAIQPLYQNKVLGIDVLRSNPTGQNPPSALLIENQHFYAVDEQGRKFSVQ